MATSTQALIILNIGSFSGQALMILFANRINRVTLQLWGFILLACIFLTLGTIFITLHRAGGALIVALYVIAQTAFNFGPNSTTYILAGELFPTRYRGSCHGISAAAGKLGSILVQLFSAYYHFGSNRADEASTRRYGIIVVVFAGVMLLGAGVTWWGVPNVQERRGKGGKKSWTAVGRDKTLEELALGRKGVESEAVRRAKRRQI
jgi:MFS transporter, PHS family, inorganic phosphate transporter